MKRFASQAAAAALANALAYSCRAACSCGAAPATATESRRRGTPWLAGNAVTIARRFQSSGSSSSSSSSSSSPASSSRNAGGGHDHSHRESQPPFTAEQQVINKAKPNSTVMEERLGFTAGEAIDEETLKENFFVLAKHYHPDSSTAPPNSQDAFASIKEAYDILLKDVRGDRAHTDHSGGFGSDFSDDHHYADEAQRRAKMRALGDGVVFFLLATIAYITVVAVHNRKRMDSRYLLHFLGCFFVIQLFPRLLAAALLFAVHTSYLIENNELREQADVALLMEKTPHDLHVRVEGIRPGCTEHTVVQVETVVEPGLPPAAKPQAAAHHCPSPVASVLSSTTTLTLDPGVTSFALPLPPEGEERNTTYKVKAVDQIRKFVIVEKQFKLA